MSALEAVLLCLYGVLFAAGGWRVGVYKGYPWSGAAGAAAGLIFGPLGILAMVLIPSSPAAAQQREQERLHAARLAEEAERRTREDEDLALSGEPRRSPLRCPARPRPAVGPLSAGGSACLRRRSG